MGGYKHALDIGIVKEVLHMANRSKAHQSGEFAKVKEFYPELTTNHHVVMEGFDA